MSDDAPELESLGLDELRHYRQRLRDEEDRVSYWRRVVHARMDLLTAGRSTDGSISVDELVRVLGDTGTGAARTALMRVRAAGPLPDVPDLTEIWVVPRSADDAARQLSALKHVWISARLGEMKMAESHLSAVLSSADGFVKSAILDVGSCISNVEPTIASQPCNASFIPLTTLCLSHGAKDALGHTP